MPMINLEATCDLQVNGEAREIFMSYGLINELSRIVQDPARIPAIYVDPDVRDAVLLAILAERNEAGKVLNKAKDIYDFAVSLKDIDKMLGWAMTHLTDFFVQGVLQSRAQLDYQQERLPKESA